MSRKEAKVLVVVVGGNVSLYAKLDRNRVWSLEPATLREIRRAVVGKHEDEIVLREDDVEGEAVRVVFEELDAGRRRRKVSRELKDSSAIEPGLWEKLAKMIHENRSLYQGFVVLHGLDTMTYTASALSFMLRNLATPVVFSGSQLPLNYTRTDAQQNVVCAITLAATRSAGEDPVAVVPEVGVFSVDTLYRANRARMSDPSSYRAFDSSNYPPLAQVGEYLHVNTGAVLPDPSARIDLKPDASAPVNILDIYPGIEGDVISRLFPQGPPPEKPIAEAKAKPKGGLLLKTYGMGTAPTLPSFMQAIGAVVAQGIVVMNVTQAHAGHLSLPRDPVSLRLFEHGVIYGADMTAEAAYAKMKVLLSQGLTIQRAKEELQICQAGEQSRSLVVLSYSEPGGSRTKSVEDEEFDCAYLLKPSVSDQWQLPHREKIRQIQLRVFGLVADGNAGSADLDVYVVDRFDEKSNVECTLLAQNLRWEMVGDEEDSPRTVNCVADVTHQRRFVSSADTIIKVASNPALQWSRIEIAFYVDSVSPV